MKPVAIRKVSLLRINCSLNRFYAEKLSIETSTDFTAYSLFTQHMRLLMFYKLVPLFNLLHDIRTYGGIKV
jgi:hypothetical protein